MSSSPKIPRVEEPQSPNYSNEEVIKQIRQHLFCLLHAQNCHQECPYPDCWKVKNIIKHIAMCFEGKSCQTSLCLSSKNILKHYWQECTQQDCPVCSPFRKDNSENVADRSAQKPNSSSVEETLQATVDPQDSTLDKPGASTAGEGATGDTGASSNVKDPVQPSSTASTDGFSIFDYALDEDPNIGTRCKLPDLHRIWHKSFKEYHLEARKIYKMKNQPAGVYDPSCVIETLRKSDALNTIFGRGNCLGLSSLNQQLVLALISYLCYRRGTETQQCTHTSCILNKINLRHVDRCEDGKSCTKPHCRATRDLIEHWKRCLDSNCPVCLFVKKINMQLKDC